MTNTPGCTAPIKGHTTVARRLKCPACGRHNSASRPTPAALPPTSPEAIRERAGRLAEFLEMPVDDLKEAALASQSGEELSALWTIAQEREIAKELFDAVAANPNCEMSFTDLTGPIDPPWVQSRWTVDAVITFVSPQLINRWVMAGETRKFGPEDHAAVCRRVLASRGLLPETYEHMWSLGVSGEVAYTGPAFSSALQNSDLPQPVFDEMFDRAFADETGTYPDLILSSKRISLDRALDTYKKVHARARQSERTDMLAAILRRGDLPEDRLRRIVSDELGDNWKKNQHVAAARALPLDMADQMVAVPGNHSYALSAVMKHRYPTEAFIDWARRAREDPRLARVMLKSRTMPDEAIRVISSSDHPKVVKEVRDRGAPRLIPRLFDIDKRNHAAIEYLSSHDWWTLSGDSPEVVIARTMFADP